MIQKALNIIKVIIFTLGYKISSFTNENCIGRYWMEGKKTTGRPILMPLDWIFDNKWKYQNAKELAQDIDACQRWSPGLA